MAAEVIGLETRRRGAWRVAVGRVLRAWRTDQGLRLADVAAAAGVSTQYLSEVERGRKEPSSEILGAVTEALGSSLSELALGVAAGLREPPARTRVAADRREGRVRLRAVTGGHEVAARPRVADRVVPAVASRTAVLDPPARSSGEVTLLAA